MTYHPPRAPGRQPTRPHGLVQPAVAEQMIRVANGCARGPIVEVGVYHGASAWDLAAVALEWGVELHLFDTFTGIPWKEPDDAHSIGDFSDTTVAAVLEAVPMAHVYEGIFPATLPASLTGLGLVHVDCDQYQSVAACIDLLGPRMLPGGMMFFDDIQLPGCSRAVRERRPRGYTTPSEREFFIF